MYERPLSVSTDKGARIVARIVVNDKQVQIQVPYLKEVEKDNPPFSKKGIICIRTPKSGYSIAIDKLTSYLEHLFLKGMANEDSHTSHERINKPRGSDTTRIEGNSGTDKGKGQTSGVRGSTRGDKSTEDAERRESSKANLA